MVNARSSDGLLECDMRLIDGGAVRMALTSSTIADTQLRLGPPVGALTLSQPLSGRDRLLVAGSAGLAPPQTNLAPGAALRPPPPAPPLFAAPDAARRADHAQRAERRAPPPCTT